MKKVREKAEEEEVAQRLKEQTEANEFIYHPVRDPAAFLQEHFLTIWINQSAGIAGLYGRLREHPDTSELVALLFMRVNGWNTEKVEDWLSWHTQYLPKVVE